MQQCINLRILQDFVQEFFSANKNLKAHFPNNLSTYSVQCFVYILHVIMHARVLHCTKAVNSYVNLVTNLFLPCAGYNRGQLHMLS